MEVLVVTNSCSEKMYKSIREMRKRTIIDPQQKFFRLFIDGLGKTEKCEVEVLSALPVSYSSIDKRNFDYQEEVTDEGIVYKYLPFINGKFMRYITLIFSSLRYMKKWCKEVEDKKNAFVIVDPLIPVVAIPCRKVAQKYGIKVVAIVTDLPTLATNMKERKESSFKEKCLSVYQRVSEDDIHAYDGYIPLTESINDKINTSGKPYCVVEGFADSKDITIADAHENYIMYAGGLYEKYGVKALVEAFLELDRKDMELKLFGEGSYVEDLKKVSEENPRVQYMGCVSPEEAVEYEKKALLLVNPRPTNEEFAKYSFPSKTMEYLLSGTAVVSTRLPGIPTEYFEYMYSFDGETVADIKMKLNEILSQPVENIVAFGKKGHEFVLKQKNNKVMAQKICDFMKSGEL